MGLQLHVKIHYENKKIQKVELIPKISKKIKWSFQSSQKDPQLELIVNQWLDDYAQKKPSSLQIPLDWDLIPPFTRKVLIEISKIPFGEISTYGEIADRLDSPKAARAIGGACGRNPFLLFIPCHRVLDAKKGLRGFSAVGGIPLKKSLLAFENVHFPIFDSLS